MMVFFEDMCLLIRTGLVSRQRNTGRLPESVMQEEQENNAEVMNRLNLSEYEVVRAQYFLHYRTRQ